MANRNDDPPNQDDNMCPQSEEVWGLLEEAGVDESLIEKVTGIIEPLAWAANRSCPACEDRACSEFVYCDWPTSQHKYWWMEFRSGKMKKPKVVLVTMETHGGEEYILQFGDTKNCFPRSIAEDWKARFKPCYSTPEFEPHVS